MIVDSTAKLDIVGIDAGNDGKLFVEGSSGSRALARIQRQNGETVGINLNRDQFHATIAERARNIDLGNGLALKDSDAQGMREYAFYRCELDDWNQFQIALHAG